jgi:dihydropteroate synthase
MHWQTTRFHVDLNRPRVMGIVNLTPDSFSDGGRWNDPKAALRHCEQLLRDGADMLDLGAESTRPGAQAVPLDEELHRLLPVLKEAMGFGVPLSIDTYKPAVMRAALDAGADIINDIWALRQPATSDCASALEVVAMHGRCGVCVMHMHRDPSTMQLTPMVGDVVSQVVQFLKQTVESIEALGLEKAQILVDPGIGFGKTPEQNLQLLARQVELAALGHGVLVGWSRKSTLGHVIGDGGAAASPEMLAAGRRVPSVVAALLAVQNGAHVVRVHDVRETVQALQVWQAVKSAATA